MSTQVAKVVTSPNAKAKAKEKDKERKARATGKGQTERLKVVVRRLPPNLPEEVFWQSVQQWVTDETATYKVYNKGKFKKRINKENIPSRAYIAFKNEELMATFSRDYDGHVFRDKAGNESIAVVEFSPFQKVPSEKKKVDARMGTIEKDEDYISFLESLKGEPSKPVEVENMDTLIAASQPPPQPTTTPLLEALKAEKSAQKDKEAILRNHAHYKDPAAVSGSTIIAKKDESKKKGSAASAAAPSNQKDQQSQEPQVGKKAVKKAAAAAKAAAQQASSTPQASTSGKAPAQKQIQQPQIASQKTPRPPRERQQKTSNSPASSGVPVAAPPPSGADTSSTGAAADAATPGQAAPARRTRPMLGLASRQFEAALSEAGVSATERKARREREQKEKERQESVGSGSGTPSASGTESPSKGKARENREKRGGAPPSGVPRAPAQGAPVVQVLQREAGGASVPPMGETGQGQDEGGPGPGRGGGRPRGRGRGRGGVKSSG